MKNFSNYNDYSTKEELHFESKAVHGALFCHQSCAAPQIILAAGF